MKHDSHFATVTLRDHPEYGTVRMSAREVSHQLGCAKGGRQGKGHRWTAVEASKAAKRSWRRHRRHLRRTKERVDHQQVRSQYSMYRTDALTMTSPIWYHPGENQWYQNMSSTDSSETTIRLSERTALRRLGYLPYPFRTRVIKQIVAARPGTRLASLVGKEIGR